MAFKDMFKTEHLIRSMSGHRSEVNCVAFSPDGTRALSGSSGFGDHSCRYWEIESGRELGHFDEPTTAVGFSADGSKALYGTDRGMLGIRDLYAGGEIMKVKAFPSKITRACFTLDGAFVLSCSKGRQLFGKKEDDFALKFFSALGGEELLRFEGHGFSVYDISISSDGLYALSASGDKTVRLWDLKTGKEIEQYGPFPAFALAVSFAGSSKEMVVGIDNAFGKATAQVWDLVAKREITSFKKQGGVISVSVSSDGHRVLTGSSDRSACLWERSSGQQIRTIATGAKSLMCVALNAEGKLGLTGGKTQFTDSGHLRLWDLEC